MAKIVLGILEIAGAIVLDIYAPEIGTWLTNNTWMTITSSMVKTAAFSMGAMGAGMTVSGISDLLQSGGPGIQTSAKSSNAPRVTIYGQARVAGNSVYSGSDANHTYNQVLVWASHPVASIDYIYIDGKQFYSSYWPTGEGYKDDNATHYDVAGQKYSFHGKAYVCNWTGSATGHWFRDLGSGLSGVTTADANWNSSCTLNNMAATYVACTYDPNTFSGFPTVKANVHGKCDIYDPRLGAQFLADGVTPNPATHIYTNNAALAIADFMTNNDFGCGIDWASMDIPQLISAANICDEQVPLASGSGGANSYRGTWQASRQYQLGDMVAVTVNSVSYLQQVTAVNPAAFGNPTLAVSGTSQPSWKTVAGQSVVDNMITWSCQGITPNGWSASTLSENRYTINGALQWSATSGEILSSLLDACEGRLTYTGGKFQIWPAAWYGSTLQFDQSDLVESVKETANRKFRDKINCVRATYVSPAYPYSVSGYDQNHYDTQIFNGCWQPTDAPEYACDALHGYGSDIYKGQDGGIKLPTDRRYQFVTSVGQAQRLSKIFLLRNRYQGTYTLNMNLSAYQTRPVDVIQMTFPALSWSNKLLEVNSLKFVQSHQQGNQGGAGSPALYVQLECQETDPSIYNWSVAEELTQEARQSPAYWDTTNVSAPSGLTLTSSNTTAVTALDGIVTPRVLATWTQPIDPFVTTGGSIIVQIQKSGDATWQTYKIYDGTTTQAYIDGVVGGQQYNVQVAATHATGAQSDWAAVGPITVSNNMSSYTTSTPLNGLGSVTPSQPIVVSFTTTKNSCSFSWTTQSVLRADGSTLTVPSGSLMYSGLASSTTYYSYWYINATTGVLGQTNATPPATTPSAVLVTQCANDGRISIGVIPFTTLASTNGGTGGGTGGGGDTCPERAELVEVEGKGQISAGDVQPGDMIKGYSFRSSADAYRRVTQVRYQSSAAWRMVQDHRVSPCECVYSGEQFIPAFRASGATVDCVSGTKVMISVESDEYNEQNYWLVAGEPLLIHNMLAQMNPC